MSILVPREQESAILAEAIARIKARQRRDFVQFDPVFGATLEEARATQERCAESLATYGQYVFGYEPQPHHQLWCDTIQKIINREIPQTKALFLAPPNTAKSSWISIINPAWYLGKYPTHNVLFLTSSDPNAQTFNLALQTNLGDNDRHSAVFSSALCRPDRKRGWSSRGLFLQGTPRSNKDPAYRAAGWGTHIQGVRASLLLIDDPMDQEDAMSETACEKARQYYDMTVEPRLNPDGFVFAVMTRWNDYDLASHIYKRVREDGDWLVIALPMEAEAEGSDLYPDALGRQPGELLWPERLTEKFVAEKKATMTVAEYAAVYQCSSVAVGGDVFESEDWFRPYPSDFYEKREDGLSLRDRLRVVQGWDFAFSEDERACFTSKVTIGIDSQMNLYVLDVMNERLSTMETENAIVLAAQSEHPLVLGLEETAFRKKITVELARRVTRRVLCNIQIIKPDKDKVSRARLPAFYGQMGKLFVDREAPWYRNFVRQCLAFPESKFNDMVDALSLATQIAAMLDTLKQHKRKQLTFTLGE